MRGVRFPWASVERLYVRDEAGRYVRSHEEIARELGCSAQAVSNHRAKHLAPATGALVPPRHIEATIGETRARSAGNDRTPTAKTPTTDGRSTMLARLRALEMEAEALRIELDLPCAAAAIQAETLEETATRMELRARDRYPTGIPRGLLDEIADLRRRGAELAQGMNPIARVVLAGRAGCATAIARRDLQNATTMRELERLAGARA